MAEKNALGHLSYRVATRRQSLSLPNMISITALPGKGQAATPPYFAPRLDAARCGFR